ncbi:MAG TPA: hypothetical protein VE821_07155, partial [Pyrinomonadaceae bacterium]|nr:hypothetical protein [Pyrinomonadaceae bacterium]
AIYANGNTGQALNSGGFVKAMLLVNPNGSINLCYNSQLTGAGATTPLCGFSVNHSSTGIYDITFPFQVNSRFFLATVADTTNGPGDVAVVRPFDSQTVRVVTFFATLGFRDDPFYLIVF